ncbi:hypothetical protein Lesp02_10000 [Lentzea sp. NBRC 105346]|uniref:nuclear transport factor 2 family protein n=1 Tax=Lentzea sp. NBRC 105346 TaxID=3032205 RepID=UPI0024A1F067|nr:nuclear transport factor 2 family protein [Lentzea sp. NBRC 105346]GLZ28810.1 hypothetical protein Lesp02_10000 [Lentzea sp. NBRC 105346]
MTRTPRDVAEETRRMVAGESTIPFADLFAEDGVMEYRFAPPGFPTELVGREAIRAHFAKAGRHREVLEIEQVDLIVRQTDDPEVIVTEITHKGWSKAAKDHYTFTALGVVRVRDGMIVHYDDYMNPIAMARLLGRTDELVAALSTQ